MVEDTELCSHQIVQQHACEGGARQLIDNPDLVEQEGQRLMALILPAAECQANALPTLAAGRG